MLNRMRAALGAAKVAATRTWANQLREEGRKGVVFCYHQAVADVLSRQLPGRTLTVTGKTPRPKRQQMVDRLKRADFLVATMDSMAHGVNGLQDCAQDLAFVELDHTHSKHEQSEGRLRRRGQKGAVHAYYFVAPDTYDEAMLATLQKKWHDAQGILDGQGKSRNFAEQVLGSIIAQRPWESGKVDWKAAGTNLRQGDKVQKPGKNAPLAGRVLWVNRSGTSCRVEWEGGLETFEVPGTLKPVTGADSSGIPAKP